MFHTFRARMGRFLAYKDLLKELILRDLKLKYRRSILGYFWSVLNPLMIMLVMTVIFTRVFRFQIENYPVYLLSGQMLFNFFSEATNNALVSITGNAPLLKKTYVPKYIFTFSKVTSALINLAFSLLSLMLVMLILRVPFSWKMFLAVSPLLQLYIFSIGVGMLLASMTVFFRDIQYIYSVILTAWTYATPIFYPENSLDGRLGWIVKTFNPLYHYISQFRSVMIYNTFPSLSITLSGWGFALFFLLLGSWAFLKSQDKFILYI